jgi:hypothetical protein
MAKRARGSTSRPGQRARTQRTPTRPPTTGTVVSTPSTSLTDAELARAAELEAQIVAEEKAAGAATQTSAQAAARERVAPGPRPTGTLAASASEEYAYVARDVRRIALIGGSLVALLFGAWAVIQVTGVAVL